MHPLARLLKPLEPLAPSDPSAAAAGGPSDSAAAVVCSVGEGAPERLTSGSWWLYARPGREADPGGELALFAGAGGRTFRCGRASDGTVTVPFGLAEAYTGFTAERYALAGSGRRIPVALQNAYYLLKAAIPRRAQLAARRALIRWQGEPDFPAWPADTSVSDLLGFWIRCELVARSRSELRFRWFWPGNARAAAILTHDVESAAGLRNAVRIADLEEERGMRSSFNVVAREYPIDWGIVAHLRDRGFELGVHGVRHDRSMFRSREDFDAQQPELRRMAERIGADGFRSPATHRVHEWLADLPVAYDCTVPMSDPYEPQPGGCCSPWPYFIGPLVELPWSLSQDHTVLTLLGQRSPELWFRQIEIVERRAGLIQCLSHPDPGYLGDPRNEAVYAELLDFLAERPTLWRALPREVAAWWRLRDDDGEAAGPIGLAVLDGDEVRLEPESDVRYENQPTLSLPDAPSAR
ncbi:MAG: hypothetical protein R2700_15920 [Solirubrobacterales bacterium]